MTSTSTVTVAGVGNLTGPAAGVVFESNDTTTVVSASRVGCPSHNEAGCDPTTETAVLAVDEGVSALTVAEVGASTVSFLGGVRLVGDADALNVTAGDVLTASLETLDGALSVNTTVADRNVSLLIDLLNGSVDSDTPPPLLVTVTAPAEKAIPESETLVSAVSKSRASFRTPRTGSLK